MRNLKDIEIKYSYKTQGDGKRLVDFLNSALSVSKIYKRSVGFFSSSVFEIINSGIDSFHEHKGKYRIICSPELSPEDVEAIKLGYSLRDDIVKDEIRQDIDYIFESIDDENIQLLVKLIENKCLDVKVVKPINDLGIYHDKIGIFEDYDGNKVLFVGSPNESKTAYKYNYEKIRVSRSWYIGDAERIEDDEIEFDNIWFEKNPDLKCENITSFVAREIKHRIEIRKQKEKSEIETKKEGIKLRDYQNEAISAWFENGKKGFFVMATGTGKTWTAIYAARKVADEENLFLVICAPYKHLIKQWYEDVRKVFPDNLIVLVSGENPNRWDELLNAIYDSKYNNGGTVIAISTIRSFMSEEFERISKKTDMSRMLIVDEAHRFKSREQALQDQYKYMLGLSATPSNKKNDEIGKELMDYFGGKVFDLPIEYAIQKKYLVNYNYYPLFVHATEEEEKEFDKYSRLMAGCFRNNVCIDKESCARYKRSRLRVISMAEEKTKNIKELIGNIKESDHFIVYCGDGKIYDDMGEEIRHIQFVKDQMTEMDYKVNQFTAEEKMDQRMKIVNSFNIGMIDSMVAIRCLDEGINVPSIEGALLLSSNDDYREFVQRRGRILRTYYNEYTDRKKEKASIYDVIVLPSPDSKKFAEIEFRRFYEYARLALNKVACLEKLDELLDEYNIDISEIMEIDEVLEDDLDE